MFYSGGVSGSTLNVVNSAANPLSYSPVGPAATPIYNGIGFNPVDNFIYGMPAAASNHLLRIDATGAIADLGAIAGVPSTFVCTAGEIDDQGNYYVMQNTGDQMYKIDVNTRTATAITLSPTVAVSDITFGTGSGLLYGTKNGSGELVSIDPATGAVATIGSATAGVTFGAMMGSNTGDIFGISNSGGFYKFDISSGIRLKIADASFLGANVDGAHCVSATLQLPVDLSITKTDGTNRYTPGSTTVYTIVVTNHGPFDIVTDASVTDAVPMGIPAGNVSYTAVASLGSTTAVVGTQFGAINDLVTLPVDGSVTYTVTITIPPGFMGSLVNTATITPPSNYSDMDASNNSATDTDTNPIPFRCSDSQIFYSGGAANSTLNNVNYSANPLIYSPIGSPTTPIYNGIGFNPTDGFIYGMPAAASDHILRIDGIGSITDLGPVANLPSSFVCTAGEIDDQGNYYVMQNSGGVIYKIDIPTMTASPITISPAVAVSDITYSVTTGLLYGTINGSGELVSIDPATGTVVTIGSETAGLTFGAMMGTGSGDIYGISNSGGFYRFNIITGARVKIAEATFLDANVDGAHCVTAELEFPTDISVTKTDGSTLYTPGTNTVYTIVVTNNGPFGVMDAIVSDPLPAGISSGDVTYTAIASTGSTTAVAGTQSGAINDIVSIQPNGSVTYTVTISVPATLIENLVNVVTVTPPAGTTDTDPGNNTATDTDVNSLPVKLINFDAQAEAGVSLLSWATSEEVNSSYFAVEHSRDAKSWTIVGFVESSGESVTRQDYQYRHITPSPGINYYRLKMVDADDTYAYSVIRSIQQVDTSSAGVYPNPVSVQLFLKGIEKESLSSLTIYNGAGIKVFTSLSNLQSVNVSNLPDGLYILVVKTKEGTQHTHTFVVRK
ncbi:conserved repeat domain-containing protein/Por secretion system C-terminal sorting domain-containing protein [Dyadobacter sp. SG02]|nr:conserved repeat domain-containing protein/Por secretion system C-terminal sorting domain-containing protein [Dyadobacter sp. SG02]